MREGHHSDGALVRWCDDGKCSPFADLTRTAAHSVGPTQISFLTNPAPTFGDLAFSRLSIRHVVVMDPWVEPLPSPGPPPFADGLTGSSQPAPPPLLVINSEGYTVWKENFEPLQGIVGTWNGGARLLTVVRSQHQSFSDFPLLFSFGKNALQCLRFLDIFGTLSLGFLSGRLDETIERYPQATGEVETTAGKAGTPVSRLVGEAGHVIVHL